MDYVEIVQCSVFILFVCSLPCIKIFLFVQHNHYQDKDLDAEGVYQTAIHDEAVHQLLLHMTSTSQTKDELMAMVTHRTPPCQEFTSIWEGLVVATQSQFERTKGVASFQY